ncbi:MAG: hypothetical protein KBD37_10310 [Burkholderiales bacterium]|nr:hypothetical protein [Burkholderiales bacterium]
MFKKMLLIMSAALIISCGGANSAPVPAPVPTPPPTSTPAAPKPAPDNVSKLSGDGWELLLPNDFQLKDVANPSLVVVAFNNKDKRLVILSKNEFAGTVSQYTTEAVSVFKEVGMTITSQSTGTLNSTPFARVDGVKGPLSISHWFLVKSNYGYTFACGGLTSSASASTHTDACNKIASNLLLK